VRILIAPILMAGLMLTAAAGRLPGRAVRVAYVTESKGFKHAVLPESEEILKSLGSKQGFDVTVYHEAAQLFTPANLSKVDVIIFYTTGDLPLTDDQKRLFLEFVKSGGGFIGIHSATDTFYKWPEYGEMIGAYFDGHPWTQDTEVGISAFDRSNPITRVWPESFRLQEEIYQFRDFDPAKSKATIRLDTEHTDMTRKGIKAKEFPLAWYRNYGKGRVFYTALGHRPEVWRDNRYQAMIVNAIRWASNTLD